MLTNFLFILIIDRNTRIIFRSSKIWFSWNSRTIQWWSQWKVSGSGFINLVKQKRYRVCSKATCTNKWVIEQTIKKFVICYLCKLNIHTCIYTCCFVICRTDLDCVRWIYPAKFIIFHYLLTIYSLRTSGLSKISLNNSYYSCWNILKRSHV